MILAFGEAFAYVWSGAYGNLEQIGVVNEADVNAAMIRHVVMGYGIIAVQRPQRFHQQLHDEGVFHFANA